MCWILGGWDYGHGTLCGNPPTSPGTCIPPFLLLLIACIAWHWFASRLQLQPTAERERDRGNGLWRLKVRQVMRNKCRCEVCISKKKRCTANINWVCSRIYLSIRPFMHPTSIWPTNMWTRTSHKKKNNARIKIGDPSKSTKTVQISQANRVTCSSVYFYTMIHLDTPIPEETNPKQCHQRPGIWRSKNWPGPFAAKLCTARRTTVFATTLLFFSGAWLATGLKSPLATGFG